MGKLFGLIGHPVGHSMSPAMHNDAFLTLGLNHYYHAFDVKEEDLQSAVEGIRSLGIAGFNVTIPHKVEVMKYLDEVDEEAKIIGAVNTVVCENDKLIGYNTDGQGYVSSLLDIIDEDELKQKSILIVGAGGAARAIAVSLLLFGVHQLTITNRTKDKAETLRQHCLKHGLSVQVIDSKEAENTIADYDIIINSTSVGMSPNIEHSPLQIGQIKPGTIVSDLIYNPLQTKLLEKAHKEGAVTHSGIGMFVYQGALAFEKWTGIKPNYERMKQIVLEKLGG